MEQIVAVIDIGSTKVSCCIASVAEDGNFNVLGTGYCACFGVKAGIITDIHLTGKSIAIVVENAEKAAGFRIKSVFVSISGIYVTSEIINAELNIGGRIIKQQDIDALLYQKTSRNSIRSVIHAIPLMFEIDSIKCGPKPEGMFANILKASVNVISAPRVQLNNLLICLSRCHLNVLGFVYSGLASGLSVLSNEIEQRSQIVVDFGGGVTSVNFFYNNLLSGLEIIPLGAKSITKDIAYGFNVSPENAERLKTLHGAAFVSSDDNKHMVLAPIQEEHNLINLQQISKSELNRIIQPRVEEIIKLVKAKIDDSNFKSDFAKGIIITGGGSYLTGLRELMSETLKKPVEMKELDMISENSGIHIGNDFATAIGMIKYAYLNRNPSYFDMDKDNKKNSFLKNAINWIKNNL